MEVIVHLDTNAYCAFISGRDEAVFIVERAPSMALSPVVIGELKAGFSLGNRTQRNLDRLQRFLDSPRVFVPPMDLHVTNRYARIFKQLRLEGRPIPTNDLWIAAFALEQNNAVFSYDAHFNPVDDLRVIHSREDFLRLLG